MSVTDHFPDVDEETLHKMLVLIRDRFEVATAANYYLEHQAGVSGTTIGITNLRDVLSYLASMLGGPNNAYPQTVDQQKAQVSSAEEHFRRAVYEPYENAASTRVVRLEKIIEKYKTVVISRGPAYVETNAYASLEQINMRVKAIADLRSEARAAKAVNLWNAQWEDSVKKLLKVNEAIISFSEALESTIITVEADKSVEVSERGLGEAKKGTRMGRYGIFWTIGASLVTLILGWAAAKYL